MSRKSFLLSVFHFPGNQLTQFIKHYEPLNYDKKDLRNKHLRVRRSVGPHEELHLNFESHGRYCILFVLSIINLMKLLHFMICILLPYIFQLDSVYFSVIFHFVSREI